MDRARLLLAAVLAAPLALAGCGDDAPPAAPPAAADHASADLPEVPILPAGVRAAYALERLLRGPAPLNGLPVAEIHRRNLELAFADLIAMEDETTGLLGDPGLQARIVGGARANVDPWHNVLRVMLAFRRRPPPLVVAWTRPVLDVPRTGDQATLRAEAVRLLGQTVATETGDAEGRREAADVLLALFRQSPADREIGALAFSALVQLPSHRDAALDVAMRDGAPSLWADAWSRLAGTVPTGEVDEEVASALAWLAAFTAASGPRLPEELPLVKAQPWMQGRLGTDPRLPPAPRAPDGGRLPLFAALPSETMLGSGWYATPLDDLPVLPLQAYLYTGKIPAAFARCVLARWGFEGYREAVVADTWMGEADPGLTTAAQHCMLEGNRETPEEALAQVDELLDGTTAWDPYSVRQLQQRLDLVPSCETPGAWARYERVLREVRPLDVARAALEQAYAAMEPRGQPLVDLVLELLRGSPEDQGIALHLIRHAREPVYIEALEALLDRTTDASRRRVLQRALVFIHARGYGIEPSRYAAFVKRYEGWLAELDPPRASALATGLLDLGEPGVQAFARGLRGPRRPLYVAAWPRDRRIVPLAVAEALMDPMGPDTPVAERLQVLEHAYTSFPRAADRLLEALRVRLPLDQRGPVEAALERVRHRAERHGDLVGG